MTRIILWLLSLIPSAFKQRSELAIENLALRQRRSLSSIDVTRGPSFGDAIDTFGLSFWTPWKEALVIVKPRDRYPMASQGLRVVLDPALLPPPSRSARERP